MVCIILFPNSTKTTRIFSVWSEFYWISIGMNYPTFVDKKGISKKQQMACYIFLLFSFFNYHKNSPFFNCTPSFLNIPDYSAWQHGLSSSSSEIFVQEI